MLTTAKITQVATDPPSVHAFWIEGDVTIDEMAQMAKLMNAAFERGEVVNMLLILLNFDMSDAASGLSLRSIESQIRSLAYVRRYAVVGAPSFAAAMIEIFDKVSPIEAKTFGPEDEAAAWKFVGAEPVR